MSFEQSSSERQARVDDVIRAATEKGEGWTFDYFGKTRRWHFFKMASEVSAVNQRTGETVMTANLLHSACGAVFIPWGSPLCPVLADAQPQRCKACSEKLAAAARQPELSL